MATPDENLSIARQYIRRAFKEGKTDAEMLPELNKLVEPGKRPWTVGRIEGNRARMRLLRRIPYPKTTVAPMPGATATTQRLLAWSRPPEVDDWEHAALQHDFADNNLLRLRVGVLNSDNTPAPAP